MTAREIATSRRRLLKLAAFLEKLPRERFDYGYWAGPDWKGARDLSCGTTACALGWATTMPEFRRLGLRLVRPGPDSEPNVRTDTARYGVDSAAETFLLTKVEAEYLFVPETPLYGTGDQYWIEVEEAGPVESATPKQVACPHPPLRRTLPPHPEDFTHMSHYTLTVVIPAARLKARTVEEALNEMLAPFEESPEKGSPFLVFKDTEAENRKQYEEESVEKIRTPQGALFWTWDKRFDNPAGPFAEPRYIYPADCVRVTVPFRELYPTFDAFLAEYVGEKRDASGRVGYWRNPNAKWDWWSIGGRWMGRIPTRAGVAPIIGVPGTFGNKSEGGSDIVRKRNIDFDGVAEIQRKDAAEWLAAWRAWVASPIGGWDTPRERAFRIGLARVVQGPAEPGPGEIAIPWASTFLHCREDQKTWTDLVCVPSDDEWRQTYEVTFSPLLSYAALTSEGWIAPGEMGWFGMSTDGPNDYLRFAREFNDRVIKRASDDDVIVNVDCHI